MKNEAIKSDAVLEYERAVMTRADTWVPACNGLETWTRARNGREFLYVFNPAQGRHGWLERDADIVRDDDPFEAAAAYFSEVER